MNQNKIGYEGKVKVKYISRGKEITYKGHNEGLNPLFKYICKVLSGDTKNLAGDRPSFIDVRCKYFIGQSAFEDSCLYNTLSISNPEYFYDVDSKNWVTRFKVLLSYNMINYDVVEKHPDGDINLYLMSLSGNDMARLTLDSRQIQLTDILPGTQALIEWTMLLTNVKGEE